MFTALDPIRFVEESFELNGKTFTLIDDQLENARHYLRGIYYSIAFQLPKLHKPMVIVKGRQVEMSTTLANLIAYYTETYPYFKTLYVCPALDQIKRFSGERIAPLLRYKKNLSILKPLKSDGDIEGTFTIKMKQFSNGSTIYLEAAADEGNNIRNIAAELLVKDEFQDLDENAEGNIDSVLDHSEHNLNITLGTPKYTNSKYERKWLNSTQMYFHLQCPACKHWFTPTMESLVEGFVMRCPKCQNKEDKRLLVPTGKWIPMGSKDATYIGYHLSQLLVPWVSKEKLMQKIDEKTKDGSNVEKYLKNEVLGEFYAGLVQKPPRESIEKAYKTDLPYHAMLPLGVPIYAGVDWGGWSVAEDDPAQSLSIYASGYMAEDGLLRVNYIEVLTDQDDVKKAERVAALMSEQRVKLCIADSGYGKAQGLYLSTRYPSRFLKCKYIPGSSMTLIDTKAEMDKGVIKANIDYTLEELYSAMQNGKILIPRNKYTDWTIEHFLNYNITLREVGNHTHKHFEKEANKTKKVDAVHAINFLRLAALHDKNALGQSDLMVRTGGAMVSQRPLPLLTGHSVEEIRQMARGRGVRAQIANSIARSVGE